MEGHNIRPCEDAVGVWLPIVGSRELPFRGCDGDEQVGKRAQPHLAAEIPHMRIQLRIVLFVVTSHQHDTDQVCQGILHDLPIP